LEKWDEAEAAFRRAAELAPGNALVEAAWGHVCALRGDRTGAIEHDRRALEADPADDVTRRDLVAMLSQTGQHDEAVRTAQAGVKLHAGSAADRLALGQALRAAGRTDEALAALQQAIDLMQPAGQADATDAQSSDANRPLAAAWVELGTTQLAAGLIDPARQSLERALELDPDSHLAHFQFGNVLLSSGNAQGATQSYRRAIDLDDKFAPAYVNLASALLMDGNLGHARKAYERALALSPDDGQAHYNFGLLLWQTGEPVAARQHFIRAGELGIELPPALKLELDGPP
jgi:superkiller protein 3